MSLLKYDPPAPTKQAIGGSGKEPNVHGKAWIQHYVNLGIRNNRQNKISIDAVQITVFLGSVSGFHYCSRFAASFCFMCTLMLIDVSLNVYNEQRPGFR